MSTITVARVQTESNDTTLILQSGNNSTTQIQVLAANDTIILNSANIYLMNVDFSAKVNNAYNQSNTSNPAAAYARANIANTLSVGNTLSNNMFQVRTSARTRLNFIPGLSISITVDDDSADDKANVTITAPDVIAAFNQANNVTAAFLKANTAGTDATNAFGQANNVVAAFNQANNVTAAFNKANTAGTDATNAFGQANNVTAAFLKANTAGTDATNAFGQANNVTAAFLKANTAGTDAINAYNRANAEIAIAYVIDGGGNTITTGIKGDLSIPFGCTITGVRTLLDISGNLVIDIWKTTYSNHPAVVANTIVASAKPTVTQNTRSEDTTLTGWTTTVTAGDVIRFNVDSVANTTRATITLKAKKTA